ncbi:unnamed protein product [Diamesa hyperborea]
MISLKWQFYSLGGIAIIHALFKFFWITVLVEYNENNVTLTSIHIEVVSFLILYAAQGITAVFLIIGVDKGKRNLLLPFACTMAIHFLIYLFVAIQIIDVTGIDFVSGTESLIIYRTLPFVLDFDAEIKKVMENDPIDVEFVLRRKKCELILIKSKITGG